MFNEHAKNPLDSDRPSHGRRLHSLTLDGGLPEHLMSVMTIFHQLPYSFRIADDPPEAKQEANSGLEVRCA